MGVGDCTIQKYKYKFPEIINELGNNVIDYDPNFRIRPMEIYEDAEIFKMETKGAFILVMNIPSLKLLLQELIRLNTNSKFDLICTGEAGEEVFSLMIDKKYESLFKRACIYTYSPDKYQNLLNLFPIIKGIYLHSNEVLDFLRIDANSTPIFRTLKLITLDDYFSKYKSIHQIIAKHYGKFSIKQYKIEIEKVKYFMDHPGDYSLRILDNIGQPHNQKEIMLNTLEIYKDIESNYIKIIKNYTSEFCSVYKDFNYLLLRLNERGIEAFGYFISGLIYSLNKYYKETGNGESSNKKLYRGMRLDISELLNYERFKGCILCFPSFTSTSTFIDYVADPDRYGGRLTSIPTRKQQGLFSVF